MKRLRRQTRPQGKSPWILSLASLLLLPSFLVADPDDPVEFDLTKSNEGPNDAPPGVDAQSVEFDLTKPSDTRPSVGLQSEEASSESIEVIDLTRDAEAPPTSPKAASSAAMPPGESGHTAITRALLPTNATRSGAELDLAAVSIDGGKDTPLVGIQPPLPPDEPDLPPAPTKARIIRVIDGDTYVLETQDRVRLAGVNTPEKRERIGPDVSNAVRTLLLHKNVVLAYGEVQRDHYGRLIADVQVDGVSITETLLKRGLAHLFIIPPGHPKNLDHLIALQNEARRKGLGIWSEKHYQGPLHITSFHANARGNDHDNLAGEYLRIANTSGHPLNLKGFTLTNKKGRTLVFPELIVPAGYTFQVISGPGVTQGDERTPYQIYWNSSGPIWNNDDDRATLRDPQGRWIDDAVHAPKRAHPRISSAH